MTDETAENLANPRALNACLRKVRQSGWSTTVDGIDDAISEAEDSRTIIGLRLGIAGRLAGSDGGYLYPIALGLPAEQSEDWRTLLRTSTRLKLNHPVERAIAGWHDQMPDGSRQAYFCVRADSDAAFVSLIRSLAARTARRSGMEVSALKFGSHVPLAPSQVSGGQILQVDGTLGQTTPISSAELQMVGALLDEVSDQRESSARDLYDTRAHNTRTNAVRARFNASASAQETRQILSELGWLLDAGEPSTSSYIRNGETGDLSVDSTAFIVGGDLADPNTTIYRPFDLLSEFTAQDGSPAAAERAAQEVLATGRVSLDVDVLSAAGGRPQVNMAQETTDIAQQFANAIKSAKSSIDPEIPLAFGMEAAGHHAAIVSLASFGQVRRWDERTATSLLLAAAQPVRVSKRGDNEVVTNSHAIPLPVTQTVLASLQATGVLAPVEVISSQPVLTKSGKLVREPGYHPREKVFLGIPHRDLARWQQEYHVPARPTRLEAQAAYEYLDRELLSDFAYKAPSDRARHMAYLLTCVGRNLTTGSIGFLANAQDRGTGKSLALMIGRIIAQGHPGATSFRTGLWADEETSKLLTSLLRDGGRFLHCDEIPRGDTIKGLTITELISQVDGEKKIRVLGGHDTVLQSGVITTLAGNAVELGGDANRRFLTINLAWAGAGTPIARSGFRHEDLVEFINENRQQLIAAVHTILLHGLQNKPTRTISGMGFTHDWAKVILGALSHLTAENGQDVATLATGTWFTDVEESDENGDQWGPLLSFLWEQVGPQAITIKRMREVTKAVSGGQNLLVVLPDLLATIPSYNEAQVNQGWAGILKKFLGATIPYEGDTYRLRMSEKTSRSKKSSTYFIEATGPNQERLNWVSPWDKKAAEEAEAAASVVPFE
jgi:hypothetical protein